MPWWLGPSGPGDAGAVEHEGDAGAVERDIHQHLVEGAIHERGVDRDDRVQTAVGEARGRGHRMLLGDADVVDAVREALREGQQSGGTQHRGGDADDLGALLPDGDQLVGEDIGPGRGAAEPPTGSPDAGSMRPTAWNWSASSSRAGW